MNMVRPDECHDPPRIGSGRPRRSAGALATAQRIDVAAMPASLCGRQAQVHLDSAWAHAQLRDDALAVIHLLDVERVAPDLMVVSPEARGLIRDLLLRERRGAMPGLRGLALRAGVAA